MPPCTEEKAPREQPAEEIERLKIGALKDAEKMESILIAAKRATARDSLCQLIKWSPTRGEAVTWKRVLWRRLLTGEAPRKQAWRAMVAKLKTKGWPKEAPQMEKKAADGRDPVSTSKREENIEVIFR